MALGISDRLQKLFDSIANMEWGFGRSQEAEVPPQDESSNDDPEKNKLAMEHFLDSMVVESYGDGESRLPQFDKAEAKRKICEAIVADQPLVDEIAQTGNLTRRQDLKEQYKSKGTIPAMSDTLRGAVKSELGGKLVRKIDSFSDMSDLTQSERNAAEALIYYKKALQQENLPSFQAAKRYLENTNKASV